MMAVMTPQLCQVCSAPADCPHTKNACTDCCGEEH